MSSPIVRRAAVACLCLTTLAAVRLQSPKDERPRKVLPPKLRLHVTRIAPRVLLPPSNAVMLTWLCSGYPSCSTNVVGCNVYYGIASRTYTNKVNVGNVTNAVLGQLYGLTNSAITYYFTVTAYDTTGLENDYSNEVTWKKLDTIVTVSAGTNSITLTNAPATQQFWRLKGLSWTSSQLLNSGSVKGPWSFVKTWQYPSNSTPPLSITVTYQ